jgi:hypothetical protein
MSSIGGSKAMTKQNIVECLDEIGYRFVKAGCEDDPQHYKELGIAFGVAYHCVTSLPTAAIETLAKVIEELGLAQGSVQ